MSNMSYCRFRNTLDDLRDCYDEMAFEDTSDLSAEEDKAMRCLIRLCRDIAQEFGDDQ